jgi:hypothetical protein
MPQRRTTRRSTRTSERRSSREGGIGKSSIFNEKSPQQKATEDEERRKQGNKYLRYLKIEKDETVLVRFLDREPLTFYQHRIQDPTLKQGEGGWRNLTCLRRGCPLCAIGNKARFVGAFRVVHITDEGNFEKIFIKGNNTLLALGKKDRKKSLTSENVELERVGDGVHTQYLLEWTGEKETPDFERVESDDLEKVFAPDIDAMRRLSGSKSKSSAPSEEATETDDEDYDEDENEDGDNPPW